MKKVLGILAIVILVLGFGGVAQAGALTDLEQCWTEQQQIRDAIAARAALEYATRVLDEAHQKIQELVDSGSFDTIPTDLKVALNAWWTIIKAARASIGANEDIMDVYNWRPPK